MRHIMVLNSKGGCGKSTLATNIASYFATEGAAVALADYDPQRSGLDWLARRPATLEHQHLLPGTRSRGIITWSAEGTASVHRFDSHSRCAFRSLVKAVSTPSAGLGAPVAPTTRSCWKYQPITTKLFAVLINLKGDCGPNRPGPRRSRSRGAGARRPHAAAAPVLDADAF